MLIIKDTGTISSVSLDVFFLSSFVPRSLHFYHVVRLIDHPASHEYLLGDLKSHRMYVMDLQHPVNIITSNDISTLLSC